MDSTQTYLNLISKSDNPSYVREKLLEGTAFCKTEGELLEFVFDNFSLFPKTHTMIPKNETISK
jgi:hypothetical protein